MKKLLLILFAIALVSCMPQAPIFTKYINDYRQYTEAGFFITPAKSINYNHRVLAEIKIEAPYGYFSKKVVETKKNANKYGDPIYDSPTKRTRFEVVDISQVIDSLVSYAKTLGADGIIGIETQARYPSINTFVPSSYIARGYAIKFEN